MRSLSVRSAFVTFLVAALAACGGGGGDGGTGPITVATVVVSSSKTTFLVGESAQFSAVAKSSSGAVVSGITFTWSSSDNTLATVSGTGLVTAVAVGSPTITATAQGKSGGLGLTVNDVVATVDVSPATPNIGVTGTVVLLATPRDASGNAVSRATTWVSSDPSKVSLSAAAGSSVTATGVALGNGVTVTATAAGKNGTSTLNVVAGNSPKVTSITPNPMIPGASVTITGTGFNATVGNNTVTVDGMAASVTAATATQLTATLPTGFACSDVRDVSVVVQSLTLSGSVVQPLDPTTLVSLTVGQSVFYDVSAAAGACLKWPASLGAGATYLVSVNNSAATPGSTSFELTTATAADVFRAQASVAALSVPLAMPARAPLPDGGPGDPAKRAAFHRRLLERDRRMVAARGGPAAAKRSQARRPRVVLGCCGFNPHVGDTMTVRIDDVDHDQDCTEGFAQRARVVYVSSKTVVFDDLANPLFGQIDSDMNAIATEFDNVTLDIENTYFGNPLAYDASLGNKGHVLIFFTSKVNGFGGGNIAGFVNGCDFFPFDATPGPNQDTVTNEASIFYAYVPTTTAAVAQWHSFIRSVLPHETKHIVSYSEKFELGATGFEDPWLEESTAQIAAEIYGRNYSSATWKGFAQYATTLHCEWLNNFCGGDHPLVMINHFSYLSDYLSAFDTESPIADASEVYYGGAWSFVRWALDQYATDEPTFLKGITQTATVFGTANLELRAGAPFGVMTSRWANATALARFPVLATDPLLSIPSWDQHNIYVGLNAESPTNFPLAYPYATSSATLPLTGTILGGGARLMLFQPTAKQMIMLRNPDGSAVTALNSLRMSVVRTN